MSLDSEMHGRKLEQMKLSELIDYACTASRSGIAREEREALAARLLEKLEARDGAFRIRKLSLRMGKACPYSLICEDMWLILLRSFRAVNGRRFMSRLPLLRAATVGCSVEETLERIANAIPVRERFDIVCALYRLEIERRWGKRKFSALSFPELLVLLDASSHQFTTLDPLEAVRMIERLAGLRLRSMPVIEALLSCLTDYRDLDDRQLIGLLKAVVRLRAWHCTPAGRLVDEVRNRLPSMRPHSVANVVALSPLLGRSVFDAGMQVCDVTKLNTTHLLMVYRASVAFRVPFAELQRVDRILSIRRANLQNVRKRHEVKIVKSKETKRLILRKWQRAEMNRYEGQIRWALNGMRMISGAPSVPPFQSQYFHDGLLLDFYVPSAGLAIEVNGDPFHYLNGGVTDDDLTGDDLLRIKVLEGAGIRVLNVPLSVFLSTETKRTYLAERLIPLL